MNVSPIGRRAAVALAVGAGVLATAGTAVASGPVPGFGTGGVSVGGFAAGVSDRYFATTAAPGGGSYNVGYTTVGTDDRVFLLTRTGPTGALDPTFGTGGVATVNVSAAPFPAAPNAPSGAAQAGPTGGAEVARGVVVQSDGRIVVSGQAETPAASGKPDSRDLDIYVARFTTSGQLDPTFGVGGVRRIDLSDGITVPTGPAATTTTVRTDQAYGLAIRPDDRLLLTTVQGSDSSDNATRADQDLAAVSLTRDGALDGSFGSGGVAVARTPGINENPRNGAVEANGAFITTGYGSPAGQPTRPLVYRFLPDGALDPSFGTGGIATAQVGGAAGRAEVYGVVDANGWYYLAGYGSRNGTPTNTDLIIYRFDKAGQWDQAFGTDGLVSYGGIGGADRARNLTALPDGRIVAVGGTEVSLTPSATDGLVFAINPDGSPDTTPAPDGALKLDLGGPGDFLYGVHAAGTVVTVVGYRGGATAPEDEVAIARLDFTLPPATPPATQPPAVEPPAALARTAGKVSVRCARVGKAKKKIRCTVIQGKPASGQVRVTLERKGQKRLSARAKTTRTGKATITLKPDRKRARAKYALTVVVPTPAGTRQTIERRITVR
jgi:uncharacterized delta-60 repeat protein